MDIFIPELNLAIDFDKFEHYYGVSSLKTGFHKFKSRVLEESGVKLEVVSKSEITMKTNDVGATVIPAVDNLIKENLK